MEAYSTTSVTVYTAVNVPKPLRTRCQFTIPKTNSLGASTEKVVNTTTHHTRSPSGSIQVANAEKTVVQSHLTNEGHPVQSR